MVRSRVSKTGEETRAKIIDATLDTIREQGVVGTTARAIAARGGFNQALIFYHFGSLTNVVQAAVEAHTDRGIALYEARLAGITTIDELIRVGQDLMNEYQARESAVIIAQLLAAAQSDPAIAHQLSVQIGRWETLLADSLRRVLEGTPLAGIVPYDDAAHAISAFFLGLHQRNALEPDAHIADRLLALVGLIAPLALPMMTSNSLFRPPS